MNQFIVSARKYRPTSFKEVISQSHITTTLQNAIASGQLAHAFLFCGPHGVGKTTCARIFAKAINCLQRNREQEPCNQCANCLSFSTNSAMNIYELDAASNNSVEDIRDLVAQVRYGPQVGRYKTYIIDEVHMLSNAAFNAFLKTLEEPPSYALFILATTERHKLLPTLLSRCQIFNFHTLKAEAIVAQLKAIAQQESIAYELSALQLIAQKAEGAMRDALSMFDLIATAADKDGRLTYSIACTHLQHLDYDCYLACTESCLKKDVPALLSLYDRLLSTGVNGHHFVVGLGEHFRNLLVCQDPVTLPLLEVPDHIRPSYAEHAAKWSTPFLLRSLTLINQSDINYKASKHQRLHVELLLIDLATGAAIDQPTAATCSAPADAKKKTAVKSKETALETAPIVDISSPNRTIKRPDNLSVHLPETVAVPTLKHLNSTLRLGKTIQFTQSTQERCPTNQPKVSLTKEKVVACLADYRNLLKKQGNIAGYHLMNQPIDLQNEVISLALINPVQEDMLKDIRENLTSYLRKTLQHSSVTIQGILVEQLSPKKPYTNQEKLIYLRTKNVAVALIQERFKLEPAF